MKTFFASISLLIMSFGVKEAMANRISYGLDCEIKGQTVDNIQKVQFLMPEKSSEFKIVEISARGQLLRRFEAQEGLRNSGSNWKSTIFTKEGTTFSRITVLSKPQISPYDISHPETRGSFTGMQANILFEGVKNPLKLSCAPFFPLQFENNKSLNSEEDCYFTERNSDRHGYATTLNFSNEGKEFFLRMSLPVGEPGSHRNTMAKSGSITQISKGEFELYGKDGSLLGKVVNNFIKKSAVLHFRSYVSVGGLCVIKK